MPVGKTAPPAVFVPRPADSLCPVVLRPVRRGGQVVASVPTPSFAAELRVQWRELVAALHSQFCCCYRVVVVGSFGRCRVRHARRPTTARMAPAPTRDQNIAKDTVAPLMLDLPEIAPAHPSLNSMARSRQRREHPATEGVRAARGLDTRAGRSPTPRRAALRGCALLLGSDTSLHPRLQQLCLHRIDEDALRSGR